MRVNLSYILLSDVRTSELSTVTLCVYLCCRQYMVAIPAVLESAEMSRVCVNLLQTNQSLIITVTLRSPEENTTIFSMISSKEFYSCTEFQVSCRDWLYFNHCFFENVLKP